jgi:hypothetical protein
MRTRCLLILASLLLFGGCSSGGEPTSIDKPGSSDNAGAGGESAEVSCADDPRVKEFSNGLAETGARGLSVTLDESDPASPARGDNGWNVTVRDASGSPLQSAQLVVTARMPDHGHMSPTTPEAAPTDIDGHTMISGLNFFMAGVWLIELQVTEADAEQPADNVSFEFCIEG